MTPTPDPTLAALHEAATRNPAMCGVLGDWYEEHEHPDAAALARFGRLGLAWLIMTGPMIIHDDVHRAAVEMGRFLVDSGETPGEAFIVTGQARDRDGGEIREGRLISEIVVPSWEGREQHKYFSWRMCLYRKPNSPSPTRPGT